MVQNASDVDPNLLAELRPGEHTLWWGRPDGERRVIHNRMQRTVVLGVLAGFLVLLLIFCNGLIALNWNAVRSFILPFLILLDGVLLLGIWQPLYFIMQDSRHRRDLRYTLYAITDQRAMVITAPPGKSRGVASYAKADIATISRHEGKDGWGDLVFGTPRLSMVRGRRVMASASFAGIPQVRVVEEILFRTFKLDEKAAQVPSTSEQVSQE